MISLNIYFEHQIRIFDQNEFLYIQFIAKLVKIFTIIQVGNFPGLMYHLLMEGYPRSGNKRGPY